MRRPCWLVGYPTAATAQRVESEARRWQAEVYLTTAPRLQPYRCLRCHLWHLRVTPPQYVEYTPQELGQPDGEPVRLQATVALRRMREASLHSGDPMPDGAVA